MTGVQTCALPISVERTTIQDNDIVKISPLGRYHISNLVSVFQYVDATIIDTPILDDEIRDKLKDAYTIDERMERTEVFLSYLNNAVSHVNDAEIKTVWDKIFSSANDNIAEIRHRNKRGSSQKSVRKNSLTN